MSDQDRLEELLLDWEEQYEQGHDVPVAELGRDHPDLVSTLEREIAKLKCLRLSALKPTLLAAAPGERPEASATGGVGALPDFAGIRYRPLRFHAAGGLGEVFLARDEELGRDVALKRIQARLSAGADRDNLRQRFLAEAAITGRLEHPGIVPVYGMGTDASGQPFYAMRFIQGTSLKDAIDAFHADPAGQLAGLRSVLQRLIAVCNAVAYAHSRGVVHRDLKPANVMLGKYGETLLVDWGLAKVIGRQEGPSREGEAPAEPEETLPPPSPGADGRTIPGAAMGTPAYMSPEQANGRWAEVGPGSDVFSLGATLYHLLTGRPPYTGPRALEAARLGQYERPRKLNRRVPPALEAVCLKALAAAPSDRHATALDLAKDLERWLADEPISCYREPVLARLARWARRNRALAAGSVAVLAAAVVFLAVLVVVIEQARHRTEQARTAEAGARQQTREALDTLTDEVVGRLLARQVGPDDEEKDFLRRVLAHYEAVAEEASDEPRARVRLAEGLHRVGMLRKLLGDAPGAEEALRRARDMLAEAVPLFPGQTDPARGLAQTHRRLADVLHQLGRRQEAETEYGQALTVLDRLSAEAPKSRDFRLDRANVLNELSQLLQEMDRFDKAETTSREAIELLAGLADELPGNTNVRRSLAVSRLHRGHLFDRVGNFARAEVEYREALRLFAEQAPSRSHDPVFLQNLAGSHSSLAHVLWAQAKLPAAEKAYRDAFTFASRLVHDYANVPDYRKLQASIRMQWGVVLQELRRKEDAEEVYRRAIDDWQSLAEQFPELPEYREAQARAHNHLGRMLRALRRPGDAEVEYRKALKLAEGLAQQQRTVPLYGESHSITWQNLANVLLDQQRPDDALAAYQRSIDISTRLVRDQPRVPDYRQTLIAALTNRAVLLAMRKRYREAAEVFDSARTEQKGLIDQAPENPEYVYRLWNILHNRAVALRDAQRLEEAAASAREALAVARPLAQRHQARADYQEAVTQSLSLLRQLEAPPPKP